MILIPNAVFASTASLLAGLYMAKTGNYRVMLVGFFPIWSAKRTAYSRIRSLQISTGALGVVGPLAMTVRGSLVWCSKLQAHSNALHIVLEPEVDA